MSEGRLERCVVGIGGALILALFLFLPSVQGKIYASPDETAIATVVEQMIEHGRTYFVDPMARSIPWLHPRSWLSQGERVIPIGFLAWPWLLHWPATVLGTRFLPILASLFIWSGVIPFYLFLRARFGWKWAVAGTALTFFFPTFLLYGNRSLFGNLIQLIAAFWVFWLLDQMLNVSSKWGNRAVHVLMGALIVFTLMIRPVEAIWLLPWMIWWWMKRDAMITHRSWVVVGGLLMVVPLLWLSRQTYDSWFAIGYFLHDNVSSLFVDLRVPVDQPLSEAAGLFTVMIRFLPFGLHPLYIAWNGFHFLLVFLWPWALSVVGLLMLGIRRGLITKSFWRRLPRIPALLSIWMVFFLLCVYGSGHYTDHIRPGAVTIGNSFIRYLLPLVPWLVVSILFLARSLIKTTRDHVLAGCIVVLLSLCGIYWAFAKDDEGVLITRRELIRYTQIRSEFEQLLPKEAIVLSERSDKIFFPLRRAVSPVPPIEWIQRALTVTQDPFFLYARPMSGLQRDAWRAQGMDVIELKNFGRERLYRISLFQR